MIIMWQDSPEVNPNILMWSYLVSILPYRTFPQPWANTLQYSPHPWLVRSYLSHDLPVEDSIRNQNFLGMEILVIHSSHN